MSHRAAGPVHGLIYPNKSWKRCEQGGMLPLFALTIFAILLMVGVSLSMSMDNRSANNLQHTADGAALGGAVAFLRSKAPRSQDRILAAYEQARLLAEQNADYKLSDLDVSAVTEDIFGQHLNIEVELQFKPVNAAAGITGRNGGIDIRRRAVATATWGFPLCILTLDESETGLTLKDKAILSTGDCIIWSNAAGSRSAILDAGQLTAQYLCAHGLIRKGGTIIDASLTEACDLLPDPMADWSLNQKPGNCTKPEKFSPPSQYIRADLNAPELDRNNRELYRGNGKRRWTDLDNRKSPTKKYLWDEDILEAAQPDYDRQRLDDNCHSHNKHKFHCHSWDAEDTLASHRNFDLTRYVPEINTDRPASVRAARESGFDDIEEFYDLEAIDNMSEAAYEDDKAYSTFTDTLKPGTYCGLDIAWGHVKMEPGIYFIKDAPLTVTRRARLTAEGVTLVFTGKGAHLRVSDDASFRITAPTEGDTAGIAIAEDRMTSDPEDGLMVSRLSGRGNAEIIGLIYLPTQEFFMSGAGTGAQASPLLQIIVNRLAMIGESELQIKFEPSQTSVPVMLEPERSARLLE